MSRAYRIRVAESLSQHVQQDDTVTTKLELLPVLPLDRMKELLGGELSERGFVREGDECKKVEGAVTTVVNIATGDVKVTAEVHDDVELNTTRDAMTDEDVGRANISQQEQALKKAAQEQLQTQLKAREAELQKQVTQQLEGKLTELKTELDSAVTRVTVAALKLRAQEMGEVVETHEEPNGNLTIKVKV